MIVDREDQTAKIALFESIWMFKGRAELTKNALLEPASQLPGLRVVNVGLASLLGVHGMERVDHDSRVVFLAEAVFVKQISQITDFAYLSVNVVKQPYRGSDHIFHYCQRLLLCYSLDFQFLLHCRCTLERSISRESEPSFRNPLLGKQIKYANPQPQQFPPPPCVKQTNKQTETEILTAFRAPTHRKRCFQ